MAESYLYVVRARVPRAIAAAWLQWMRADHLPKLLALPWFFDARLLAVDGDAAQDAEFVGMYAAHSRAALDAYFAGDACSALRAEFVATWGERIALTRECWSPAQ